MTDHRLFARGVAQRLLLCGSLVVGAAAVIRADWPEFRGPDGAGRAVGASLPLSWSETSNVAWKTPIHGRAWSSPVVQGDQVWLSSATPDGRQLSAIGLDVATGRIRHDLRLFQVAQPQYAHPFNSYASPTPVIEPGRVYVTFGSPGTAAIDTRTGTVLWTRRDLECNHYRGAGSSPILFQHLLILHFDGSDQQYLVALDKTTGKTVWTTKRSIDFKDLLPNGQPQAEGDYRKAFSTPQIVTVGSRKILFSLGSKAAYAYDPLTGRELWRIEERSSHSASTRPIVAHGMIVYPSGLPGQILAVRPDGQGMASEQNVVWRLTRGVPGRPSLLLVDDLIYMVNDRGIVSAVDAATGAVVWTDRIAGEYSASPISAAGRVYFFNEDGRATVIATGRQFRVLATNDLGAGVMASPAVTGNALVVRTHTHLYRLETAR
jgi:outer membrane protein assembly factor BamB